EAFPPCVAGPRAGAKPAAAPLAKSRPERLRLGKGPVGALRVLEHVSDARFLPAGKATGGEGLLRADRPRFSASGLGMDDAFGQPRMHRDIVQVAESILEFLQSGDERLPPPRGFLVGERASEEFRGVAELLGL